MDVLVNRMRPMTAPAWSNDYIDEVNTRIGQGRACIGFNWLATVYGLLDPKTSRLGRSKDEILQKLGFAPVPGQVANPVPLGGMGMHVSAHISPTQQAEAMNFIKWFERSDTQRSWAVVGGVPARTDALRSPEFLSAAPWNKVYADSVPRLRDFWNVPQYARLLSIQTSNVNAALVGTETPQQALDTIAQQQQRIFDGIG
jgi:multiple sugar transport system substrate-binding protein